MIGTIARVVRGEGVASAARRTRDRIAEELHKRPALLRGTFTDPSGAPLLNLIACTPASRLGGLPIQLLDRLEVERRSRNIALLSPGILQSGRGAWRVPFSASDSLLDLAFEGIVAAAVARVGARALVLEGTAGIPLVSLCRLAKEIDVILSVHDFSLFTSHPESFDLATGGARELDSERLDAARDLLSHVRAVVFPHAWVRQAHRELLGIPLEDARVIEPGIPARQVYSQQRDRRVVASVGNVKRHKGGHLLPEIVALSGSAEWHIFGGGDEELLLPLRKLPGVHVHGYYSAGSLPSLLARHRVSLAVMPSLAFETYSLAISECWSAAVPVIAVDRGGQGERIRRDGGGWLVQPDEGAAGIASRVRQAIAGELAAEIPPTIATSAEAAAQHLELYRESGILSSQGE